MTLVMMALIIGTITIAVYVRTRNLPMLAILGIYEVAAFGAILTSKLISSQYQILTTVVYLAFATGIIMLLLRLVKE
jgi:predicted membrane channel-forming protein YqfA (hemolysin III family)